MGMGRDLHVRAPAHLVGPVVVKEAPGADGAQLALRQQPADFGTVADGCLARLNDVDQVQIVHGTIFSLTEPARDMSRLKAPCTNATPGPFRDVTAALVLGRGTARQAGLDKPEQGSAMTERGYLRK